MPSDLQARAVNDEIPRQLRPPYPRDPAERVLLDEDYDPVCTDEYALYSRTLREQALAQRRRARG